MPVRCRQRRPFLVMKKGIFTMKSQKQNVSVAAVITILILALHVYLLKERPSTVADPAGMHKFQPEFEKFLAALRITEKDRNKTGADGEVGDYQIKKIYVDDVNRILGRPEFTYEDRLDLIASRQMVTIYVGYYATEKRLGRTPTFLDRARIHKGGPDGCWEESTIEDSRRVVNLMSVMRCGDMEVLHGTSKR